MTTPTSAREALLAELIGEVAGLLDRVETVAPEINESRRTLAIVGGQLIAYVEQFRSHISGVANKVQTTALEFIVERVNKAAAETLRVQKEAMNEAARAIVEKEVGPPLQQLAAQLKMLVERTGRPQWASWATYAATGAVSAISGGWIVAYFVHR